MAKFVEPKVFMIAETLVRSSEMSRALHSLGVPDWQSDASSNAEYLSEFAGKLCYMSFDTALNLNLTKTGGRNNHDYLQKGIIATGHGSVLEHSSVTFLFQDVSRILTHELVRHRPGMAYSQTSGRYVRTDEISMYFPRDLQHSSAARIAFTASMKAAENAVRGLVKVLELASKPFGMKKRLTSALRRLLPSGIANNIVVTGNHRSWRHLIESRTDPSAEEEIRVTFAEVSRQLRVRYTAIYADAVISEVDGIEVTRFGRHKV